MPAIWKEQQILILSISISIYYILYIVYQSFLINCYSPSILSSLNGTTSLFSNRASISSKVLSLVSLQKRMMITSPAMQQTIKSRKHPCISIYSSRMGNTNPMIVTNSQLTRVVIVYPLGGSISAIYNHTIGPSDIPNPNT